MKKWTKEDVDKILQSFDHEAAKTWKYVISAYLDDEFPENISIFLAQERVEPPSSRIGGNVVKANARMGWYPKAYKALERRREYGDVGDHSLLTDEEVSQYLHEMRLKLADGKQILIDGFRKTNGFAPIILDVDPEFETRRDTARAKLGLSAKSSTQAPSERCS